MAAHAPYIMPDGKSLSYYLKSERDSGQPRKQRTKTRTRGKDEHWAQLTLLSSHLSKLPAGMSDQEFAELRILQRVGHRRRTRWLNEKLLRDMAGPMNAQEMESNFKPVPFGVVAPPSAFEQAAHPSHAGVWEHFRSVDMDKQSRVLQKWTEHNEELQQQRRQQQTSVASAAAIALREWSQVQKDGRQALRKANIHFVLEAEAQILQMLEEGEPDGRLLLPLDDSFARLCVHGLAQFYGLASITRPGPQGQPQVELRHRRGGGVQLGRHYHITCSDVLMALHDCAWTGFDSRTLEAYVKTHVHGSDAYSEEYVFV